MSEQSKNECGFQIVEEEKDFILSCCQTRSLLKQVENLNCGVDFHFSQLLFKLYLVVI